MKQVFKDDLTEVYQGDSLRLIRDLEPESIGALVTDPPYSSGGQFRADRQGKTSTKYQKTGTEKTYAEFVGDNRDQRSFLAWASLWLCDVFRAAVPGAVAIVFADWRQLPIMTDAIQAGGWVWRGVVPWDKTELVRPVKGRFSSQCEYALVASKGPMNQDGGCLHGLVRCGMAGRDKLHMTAKPVEVMRHLLQVVKEQGITAPVLDPFCGSGSTLIAAASMGLRSIGFEAVGDYCEVTRDRITREGTASPQHVQKALFGDAGDSNGQKEQTQAEAGQGGAAGTP